jgi:TPR repeat protein
MGKPFPKLFSDRMELPALETNTARAEGGDAQAQFSLGIKFANEGAGQNYAEAAQWYLKAANQNHALAQFNLGVMYGRGQGVPRDEQRSLMWIRKAAHLGDAGAQHNLGMRHHRVSLDGVAEKAGESRIEAYKWLQLAAAQGYGPSEASCENVALQMTREGVADAGRRVAAFVPGEIEN